ncbi:MAG: aminoglycoside phosphotransferase [Dehalococcoidia bacterium]|nr:aminoglycoside phosphotransferase [Dehalococcoidia bacterium]
MIPAGLHWLRETESGRAWLNALPSLVDACVERWSLRVGDPYRESYVSYVLPASLADGTDVVLKIQFPHWESTHEAAALAHWDGDGAVRLLDTDPERYALLIERCRPGTPLSTLEADDALDVLVGLLPRLWKPASVPFEPLQREVALWKDELLQGFERARQPFEQTLLDAAVDALATLAASQGEQVLLHQDLHADNILRAERAPWLAIDPKPLVGEREFGITQVVLGSELGSGRAHVAHRLDRLSSELGLDHERVRGWAFAQRLRFAFDGDDADPHDVETARWLLQAA